MLVLDVPTRAHIPSLVAAFNDSPLYRKFRSTSPEHTSEIAVRSIFHICGPGVLEDKRYIDFMNGFVPDAQVWRLIMSYFLLISSIARHCFTRTLSGSSHFYKFRV